jgi:hypothetical protein
MLLRAPASSPHSSPPECRSGASAFRNPLRFAHGKPCGRATEHEAVRHGVSDSE